MSSLERHFSGGIRAIPGTSPSLRMALVYLAMLFGLPSSVDAYPLDGAEVSGISRLIGYQNAQQASGGPKIASGGLLGMADIRLSLLDQTDAPIFDSQPMDPELLKAVESIFAGRDKSNGFVVVDLSQPDRIAWAGVRPDVRQNPGTVGKQYVPGILSYATPRTLAQLMFRMEQGRLVDAWSSLEMKRYLYMTKRRYRYAYAPELANAAIYFKSGSLYQCRPEEGYRCAKYKGNSKNFMNVVTIVEWPNTDTRYFISLMSNVLKVHSAWDHARLAVAIDEAVRTRAPVVVKEEGTTAEVGGSGRS